MMDERTHPSEQNSNLNDPSGDASIDRMMRIQRVVDDCIERRLAGENLSDADLQIAHPELLPELSDELRHLAVIERARKRAGSSVGSQSDGRQLPLGDPSPPDLFPGYEILNEIQRGGQGVVYRARQSSTGRDVAIKVAIRGASATSAEIARLEQEVQVLGKLRHPGIVSIIDSGEAAGGSFYYVMDFIEGQSL
ncbi:MAG: protein kinase domain-containing protein, partial [Phycisphaerae bacterium]